MEWSEYMKTINLDESISLLKNYHLVTYTWLSTLNLLRCSFCMYKHAWFDAFKKSLTVTYSSCASPLFSSIIILRSAFCFGYGCWNVAKRIFKWYQNIFLFNQNKFLFNKIYLYDIEIYFYSINKFLFNNIYLYEIKYIFIQSKQICIQIKIFCYITFFHPINIFFHYMNFSFDTFLVTISGLLFLFAKVSILFSVYKSTML